MQGRFAKPAPLHPVVALVRRKGALRPSQCGKNTRSVAVVRRLDKTSTRQHKLRRAGADVAFWGDVSEPLASHGERRAAPGADRRRKPRSGRRATDPHVNWRRVAWLFAIYATVLSVRSLPLTIRSLFNRERIRNLFKRHRTPT
jgi:hypothetical protein